MKILIVDNYDSFTFNLVHMVKEITQLTPEVVHNDQIDFNTVLNFDKVILSPGPGIPSEAGMLMKFIHTFKANLPILGVCLGQQAIAEAFDGRLKQLDRVHHGVTSRLTELNDIQLYRNLQTPLQVGRYHSWIVDNAHFPEVLQATSVDENGIIMSLKHRKLPLSAVQYHPESILTPEGKNILQNWIFS